MEMPMTELILLSLILLFLPMSALAEAGIASKYHKDQGIADDPAVVFSENFEKPLSAISANWNGQRSDALSHSSDIPTASGGSKSIRMEAIGISGTLYKPLDKNYDQLYFRFYVKFGGNVFHHTGGYIGGYNPPTNWPQGDAGMRGKRSNDDRLFVIGFEERDDQYLGFYNNWIDMPGPSWQGMYYGRGLLKTEEIPLIPHQWYCVELMVKVNSAPDVKDGELALWMDGELIAHFRPGNPKGFWDQLGGWHTDANSPPFEGFLWRDILSYGINWVKIQNYDAKPDVWFDDLVVATSYIGPINTGAWSEEGMEEE